MPEQPAQPWTPTVHAFLRHLASEGFDIAPPGTIYPDAVWPNPELSLHDVGAMLRRLHTAGRSFTPPPDARWMPWTLHTGAHETGAVISHGNIAPWHVVFGGPTGRERPVGLIGWEYSGPVDPLDEVAVTAWYCAQLFDDDIAERVGLPDAATRAEWYRCLLDGYELPRPARADLVDRIVRFAITDNGWYARRQGFTRDSRDAEGLWTLAWQSRAALWTLEHRDLLARAAMR
jgi:hypothetical protein